jgi:hypothetical protein
VTDLERALVLVGRDIDVPEAPDLVPAVLARIGPRGERLLRRRRLALAVAFAVLAAVVATLAVPDARSAILRLLHIGGEDVEFVDELPEVPAQLDLGLTLGRSATLAEARERAPFDVQTLDERPDAVYLGEHDTVWFLYGDEERPRLLVAQTPQLRFDTSFLKKLATGGTRVDFVDIGTARGAFLHGEPHVVYLLDENGEVVVETARLARDVLVWSASGVAYRLEGDFSLEDALELARDLSRP